MKRVWMGLAVSAAVLFAGPAEAAAVKMVKLASETPAYSVDIEYPQIGVKAIDDEIAAWAKSQADALVRAARQRREDQGQFSLAIAATVVRNDAQMFEVVFDESSDMAFGHPANVFTSMNYLMPDGTRFLLTEALMPGAYKQISALAVAEIKKRATEDIGGPADPDMLRVSTEPEPRNFKNFAFTPTELIVYFAAGQIDMKIADSIEAHIPLAKLRGLLRPDWRKPLASFDCAKAATDIEKTICADRQLARLDRLVAEEYAHALRYGALMGKPVAQIRDGQRAFVAKRDKDCGSLGFGQMGKCLSTAYAARLEVLKHVFE